MLIAKFEEIIFDFHVFVLTHLSIDVLYPSFFGLSQ